MAHRIMNRAREVIQSGMMDTLPLAKKKYDALMEPLCRRFELTRNELDVLLFLANNPSFDRAADIVRIRQMTKSHVSLSITNLEQRGLLTRAYDPDDRRTAHLQLTDAAREITEAGACIQEQFFACVFADLSEEELILWRSILERVCRNISNL